LRGRRRNIPCFIIHPQKGGQTHHGPKGVLILEADREMRNTPVLGHSWESSGVCRRPPSVQFAARP
jgi:hypothetical protein